MTKRKNPDSIRGKAGYKIMRVIHDPADPDDGPLCKGAELREIDLLEMLSRKSFTPNTILQDGHGNRWIVNEKIVKQVLVVENVIS
jgi:hypothetical protein